MSSTSSPRWYNRPSYLNAEDPWISTVDVYDRDDLVQGIVGGGFLYAENSYGRHAAALEPHNGANVFIVYSPCNVPNYK
jgi:hypothetical protein